MATWVIRKTLPVHDYGLGPGSGPRSTPVCLYWAGPHTPYLRTSSWVWISGLCPQVTIFPTCAAAEAAAEAFAGPSWRTSDLEAVSLRRSEPSLSSGREIPRGPGRIGPASGLHLETAQP